MGRTSGTSFLSLPGRITWSTAEIFGPLNLIYILYTLPRHLVALDTSAKSPTDMSPTSVLGTGLPITHEFLGFLYVLHYTNRAIITPWFGAPSMSPINLIVALMMATFQYLNSTNLGGWICYNAQAQAVSDSAYTAGTMSFSSSFLSPTVQYVLTFIGMVIFLLGFAGNITAEWTLFSLRRAAAKRKAKSEGRATVTYDKVYVIPEVKGLFRYVLFPHYSLEWLEWTGYYILGVSFGLGWSYSESAALQFVISEIATMSPRAYEGVGWYEKRFGKRPVAGRKAVIPRLL